jgi:hypothetical protein
MLFRFVVIRVHVLAGAVVVIVVHVTTRTTGTEGTMIGIPSEEVSQFCLACDTVFELGADHARADATAT